MTPLPQFDSMSKKPLNIESRADQNTLVWSKMDTWGALTNAVKPTNAMAFSLVTTPSISDNQDGLPTTSSFLMQSFVLAGAGAGRRRTWWPSTWWCLSLMH